MGGGVEDVRRGGGEVLQDARLRGRYPERGRRGRQRRGALAVRASGIEAVEGARFAKFPHLARDAADGGDDGFAPPVARLWFELRT